MQKCKSESTISCEIRCMDPADVDVARSRLDPAGVEWVCFTCQLSGEKEQVLLIGDQLASRLVRAVPEIKDTRDSRILAGLCSAELCECDVATLTGFPEGEVASRLKQLATPGLLAHRKVHGMNYFRLNPEDTRRAINKVIQAGNLI